MLQGTDNKLQKIICEYLEQIQETNLDYKQITDNLQSGVINHNKFVIGVEVVNQLRTYYRGTPDEDELLAKLQKEAVTPNAKREVGLIIGMREGIRYFNILYFEASSETSLVGSRLKHSLESGVLAVDPNGATLLLNSKFQKSPNMTVSFDSEARTLKVTPNEIIENKERVSSSFRFFSAAAVAVAAAVTAYVVCAQPGSKSL